MTALQRQMCEFEFFHRRRFLTSGYTDISILKRNVGALEGIYQKAPKAVKVKRKRAANWFVVVNLLPARHDTDDLRLVGTTSS